MAEIFSDTFTEASGTPNLDAHSPDTGTAWVLLSRNGAHTITVPSANDRAQPSADVGNGWILYAIDPDPTEADVELQTTFIDTGTVDSTDATGVFARLDDKLIDDFNRANQTPPSGWSSWNTGTYKELSISSNTLIRSGSGGSSNYGVAIYDTAFNADQEAWITITTGGGVGHELALGLRTQDIQSTTYDNYETYIDTNVDEAYIYRVDDGSYTQLGATVTGLALSSGHKVGVRMIGSTLGLWKDIGSGWTEVTTRSDSTYTAGGKIVVWIENTTYVLDDFGGGNVGATAVIFPAISGYFAGWNDDTGTNGYIYKLINGVPTQIGSNGGTFVNNSVLKFTAIGSALKLYDDAVEVISQTDTALPDVGKSGVWWGGVKLSTDDIDTNQCQDSFSVTEVEAIQQINMTGFQSTVSAGAQNLKENIGLNGFQSNVGIGALSPSANIPLSGFESVVNLGTIQMPLNLFGFQSTINMGSLSLEEKIALTGFQSIVNLGTPLLLLNIPLSGFQSIANFGTLELAFSGLIQLTGFQSTVGMGTIGLDQEIGMTGFQSMGNFGSIALALNLGLDGFQSVGNFGILSLTPNIFLTGFESTVTLGTIQMPMNLLGFQSAGNFGTLLLTEDIALTGFQSIISMGDLTIKPNITLNGFQSTIGMGTPILTLDISVPGFQSIVSMGDLKLAQDIMMSGFQSTVNFGDLDLLLQLIINLSGFQSTVRFGNLNLGFIPNVYLINPKKTILVRILD
jgi:hypothetical protein